ncbi:hypothetical protein [Labilithrix luteola]|uniref:hypothetical protein n=1 Tax=Labilithrix luteola TaxID=1391654 RepID=UPI0011BAC6F8|nr:hypothetical protein [Labilithrix luteola]
MKAAIGGDEASWLASEYRRCDKEIQLAGFSDLRGAPQASQLASNDGWRTADAHCEMRVGDGALRDTCHVADGRRPQILAVRCGTPAMSEGAYAGIVVTTSIVDG